MAGRKLKPFIATFLAANLFTALPASANGFWEFATAYSKDNYHTQVAQSFSRAVEVCTGGSIKINVHSGGSLYRSAEIKKAVEVAAVPIGEVFLASYADLDPLFSLDSLPFVATDYDQSLKLHNASKNELEALLAKHNTRLLYSVPWSPQGIFTDNPIEDLSSLSGKGFFAFDKTTRRIAELTGMMMPPKVKIAELEYAIDLKKVEILISSAATGYNRKIWNRLSYFYDIRGWLPRNYVLINEDTFKTATTQVQNCLLSSARLAQETGELKARNETAKFLKGMEDNGMKILEPSEALSKELKLIGETITLEWLGEMGSQGQDILDRYKAENEE